MIDTKEFEQRLIDLEREVKNLKTAHRRGLAVVEFARTNGAVPISSYNPWTLVMRGSNDKLFPFLAQVAVTDETMNGLSSREPVIDPATNTIQLFYTATDQSRPRQAMVKIVATDAIVAETRLIELEDADE